MSELCCEEIMMTFKVNGMSFTEGYKSEAEEYNLDVENILG
ncbi:MAG: hypothetical protein ACOC3C_03585 [Candidatus Thorarchaeota archaeon]